MNEIDFKLLKEMVQNSNQAESYAWLKKDSKGYFLEWVLKDGVPKGNRIINLNRYKKSTLDEYIGNIFKVDMINCSQKDCWPGHPTPGCEAQTDSCCCWSLTKWIGQVDQLVEQLQVPLKLKDVKHLMYKYGVDYLEEE